MPLLSSFKMLEKGLEMFLKSILLNHEWGKCREANGGYLQQQVIQSSSDDVVWPHGTGINQLYLFILRVSH